MKSNKRIIFISSFILIVSLFIGCNQSATSVFKKDPIYAQNLQYTKIGKIVENHEVKALVNITYLNSVNSQKWDNGKQNFLIGTYLTNDSDFGYTIKMNDLPPVEIKDINKNDQIYKNIAFKNNWSNYQILSYDDVDETTITIVYSDFKNNRVSISFLKE